MAGNLCKRGIGPVGSVSNALLYLQLAIICESLLYVCVKFFADKIVNLLSIS